MSINTISIMSPSATYTVLGSIEISGEINGSDITKVELVNTATGQGVVTTIPIYNEGTTQWEWSAMLEVAAGLNAITATAFDVSANTLDTSINITKREISIVTLTPDTMVTQTTNSITISGEIIGELDSEMINDIKFIFNTNEVSAAFVFDSENNKYTWSGTSPTLDDVALNTITIKVTNSAGETIESQVNIQVWTATLTILAPTTEPMKYTALAFLPINGTISGNTNVVTQVQITNITNTQEIFASVSHDGSEHIWSTTDLPLNSTTNTIIITATNTAGGTLSKSFSIVADLLKPMPTFLPSDSSTNIPTPGNNIKITFNKAMNTATVISALSIAPAVIAGSWQALNDTEFLLKYTPPLKPNTEYTITLAATAKDYLSTKPTNEQYFADNFADAATCTFTTGAYIGYLATDEQMSSAQFFDYIPPKIANTFRYKQYQGRLQVEDNTTFIDSAKDFAYIPIKLVNTFRYKEYKGTLYKSLINKHKVEQIAIENLKMNRLHLFDSPNETYRLRTTSPEVKWKNPKTTHSRLHYRILLSQNHYFTNSLIFDTQHTPETFATSVDGKNFESITSYGIPPLGFSRFICPITLPEGTWYLKLLVENKEESPL